MGLFFVPVSYFGFLQRLHGAGLRGRYEGFDQGGRG